MSKKFDEDVIGAVLEYAELFADTTGSAAQARQHWVTANLKTSRPPAVSQPPDPWTGLAITKNRLLSLLSVGRDRSQVRKQLDRAFIQLENEHLIEPSADDDNLATSYRAVTPLGRELLIEGSYIEYVFGLTKVVERWRRSVVKIYHPSDRGIGTGYLVGPTLVATARHVLDELKEFVVAFEDGTVVAHAGVELPSSVQDLDIALVRLAHPVNYREPFRLSTSRELLDEVVVFGFPPVPRTNGAYLVVNRGEVSAEVTLYQPDLQVLVVSALLRGGNSGGPVVNRRGQVIGTVSQNLFKQLAEDEKSINEGLGFAVAVPSEWLQDLMSGRI